MKEILGKKLEILALQRENLTKKIVRLETQIDQILEKEIRIQSEVNRLQKPTKQQKEIKSNLDESEDPLAKLEPKVRTSVLDSLENLGAFQKK